MKYGNICWQNTEIQNGKGVRAVNIGDCLQFMMVDFLYAQFLPENYQITKITMKEMKTYNGEQLIVPLNWALFDPNYMDGEKIAISDCITPIFLAVTIESYGHKIEYFNQYNIDYLKKYGPIGCRDEYTKKVLISHGVNAYLNGCFSAVVPKNREIGKKILLIDAPIELKEYMPKWNATVESYTQQYYFDEFVSVDDIMFKAKKMYEYILKEAALVVTSRLHVASPCLAAGIPVIFAKRVVDSRFTWIDKRIPLYGAESFQNIDWNPFPVEYENEKKWIIKNAVNRIISTGKKNDDVEFVDSIYTMDTRKEYPNFQSTIYSNFDKVVRYLQTLYSSDDSFDYGIWGIGKAAENLTEYMRENYKNAKLVAAIDLYKNGDYCGVVIEKPNDYQRKKSEIIFVLPVQASNMASEVLRKKGFGEDEYVCAGDRFIHI